MVIFASQRGLQYENDFTSPNSDGFWLVRVEMSIRSDGCVEVHTSKIYIQMREIRDARSKGDHGVSGVMLPCHQDAHTPNIHPAVRGMSRMTGHLFCLCAQLHSDFVQGFIKLWTYINISSSVMEWWCGSFRLTVDQWQSSRVHAQSTRFPAVPHAKVKATPDT